MRVLTLSRSANTVLDGSGAGQVLLGPAVPGEVWYLGAAAVGANEETVTDEALCKVYCGPLASQQYYVDGTLSGSTGDSTTDIAGRVLFPGNYVIGVWSGGDAGAAVFLNVSGTRQVP
jgi:hypothetical protein